MELGTETAPDQLFGQFWVSALIITHCKGKLLVTKADSSHDLWVETEVLGGQFDDVSL